MEKALITIGSKEEVLKMVYHLCFRFGCKTPIEEVLNEYGKEVLVLE